MVQDKILQSSIIKGYISNTFDIKSENLIVGTFAEISNKEGEKVKNIYEIGNIAFTPNEDKADFFTEHCKILTPSLADKLVNQNPDKTLQELKNIIAHHYEVLDMFDGKKNLNRKELFEKREAEETVEKYEIKLKEAKTKLGDSTWKQQNPIQRLIQEAAFNCEKASNKIVGNLLTMQDSDGNIYPYFDIKLDSVYEKIKNLTPQNIDEYKFKSTYLSSSISKIKNKYIQSERGLILGYQYTIKEYIQQFTKITELTIGYQYIVKKEIIRGNWYEQAMYKLNLKNKENIKIETKDELDGFKLNACKIPVSVIIGINPTILVKGMSKKEAVEKQEVINKYLFGLFTSISETEGKDFKISESKENIQFIKNDNVANVIAYEVMDVCQDDLFSTYKKMYHAFVQAVPYDEL